MAKMDYTTGKGYTSEGLMNLCANIVAEARTDIEELSPYGISEELLQLAEAKALELNSLPTSEQDRYDKVDATKAKNDKLDEIKKYYSRIKHQASYFASVESLDKNNLYSKSLVNIKENHLLENFKLLFRLLTKNLEYLRLYGIDENNVIEMELMYNKGIDLIVDRNMAHSQAFINTVKRAELKTKLYNRLNHISAIAKHYWKNIDPRKYKKYLIAPRPKVGRKKGSRA